MPYEGASDGTVSLIANPIRLSASPEEYRKAPPRLGQDTEAVLSEPLGLSPAEIAALRERGIV